MVGDVFDVEGLCCDVGVLFDVGIDGYEVIDVVVFDFVIGVIKYGDSGGFMCFDFFCKFFDVL